MKISPEGGISDALAAERLVQGNCVEPGIWVFNRNPIPVYQESMVEIDLIG